MSSPPDFLPRLRLAAAPSGRTVADARGRALHQAADFAAGAPAGRDDPPWRMAVLPDRIELRAHRAGRRARSERPERAVALSAGAALFDTRASLAARGWAVEVDRLPQPDDPDLLALIRPVPGNPDAGLATLASPASRRRESRRRFTGTQVGDEVLRRLTEIAEREGVLLVPVVHDSHRRLVARLAQQAERLRAPGAADRGPPDVSSRDGRAMVLLATRDDDRLAWLRAGEALEHMLLELARLNWVAGPVTRVVEVPVTRLQLRAALTWHAHPQALVRIGEAARRWPGPGRSGDPAGPGRPGPRSAGREE